MVPGIKIESVFMNSVESEFGQKFNTSRILRVRNFASAWALNQQHNQMDV